MAHLINGTNRDKSGHVPVCLDRDKSGQIGTPPLGGDVPICPAALSLTEVEAEDLFGYASEYDFKDAGHAVHGSGRGMIDIGSAAAPVEGANLVPMAVISGEVMVAERAQEFRP